MSLIARGLASRFLFVVPPNNVGLWELEFK
jgi:hypothetical protein